MAEMKAKNLTLLPLVSLVPGLRADKVSVSQNDPQPKVEAAKFVVGDIVGGLRRRSNLEALSKQDVRLGL